jgi:hypothetical protein
MYDKQDELEKKRIETQNTFNQLGDTISKAGHRDPGSKYKIWENIETGDKAPISIGNDTASTRIESTLELLKDDSKVLAKQAD